MVVVFPDISPDAKKHYQVVPKEHIQSVKELDTKHAPLGMFVLAETHSRSFFDSSTYERGRIESFGF